MSSKVYVLMNEQRIVKVFAREVDAIAEMRKRTDGKVVNGTDTFTYYLDDRGDTLCMYIEEVEFVSNWTEEDEHNLCELCCLMNLWQEGKREWTFRPHQAYKMREWLHKMFPNAKRWSEPRVPVENMTWEEWIRCKEDEDYE